MCADMPNNSMRLVQAGEMRMGGGRQQAAQRRWHSSNQHCALIAKLQPHARVQHIEPVQLGESGCRGLGAEKGGQQQRQQRRQRRQAPRAARAWPWCAGWACGPIVAPEIFPEKSRIGHALSAIFTHKLPARAYCG